MTRLHKRSILKERSRVLRRRQTRAEAILWKNLRWRHLEDKKFRRQHSIGPYIVDFYCAKEKLVVEVDGSVHNDPAQREYDVERQIFLEDCGMTVVRFKNRQVYSQLSMVLERIAMSFRESPLSPAPSPEKGEGEK